MDKVQKHNSFNTIRISTVTPIITKFIEIRFIEREN
jgi:hypothetical protein